jgi:prepilin-type N-terminal cleavage/methylation domain-containing protein
VRRSGFTLIELLVIIIIISVVSSIVVPSYSRFMARANFDGATRNVRDLFAYAREQAVVNDTTVTVRFEPQSQTFAAIVTPPPPQADQPVAFGAMNTNAAAAVSQTAAEPVTVSLGGDFLVSNYQTGVQGQGGGDLHFRGDGTCEGAQIMLVSSAGYQRQLTLWPDTGCITVEER